MEAKRLRLPRQTGSAHAKALIAVPRTTAHQPTKAQNPHLSLNRSQNTVPTSSPLPFRLGSQTNPHKPSTEKKTTPSLFPFSPFLPEASRHAGIRNMLHQGATNPAQMSHPGIQRVPYRGAKTHLWNQRRSWNPGTRPTEKQTRTHGLSAVTGIPANAPPSGKHEPMDLARRWSPDKGPYY